MGKAVMEIKQLLLLSYYDHIGLFPRLSASLFWLLSFANHSALPLQIYHSDALT